MTVKQQKEAIKYSSKPASCSNCQNFQREIEAYEQFGRKFTITKNMKCGKYGFATKKMAWCIDHILI